jgi:hypothetical protein
MDTIQHHRARLGICRQRARMEGENAAFWLEEASIREQLIVIEQRMQMLGIQSAPAALPQAGWTEKRAVLDRGRLQSHSG